jgi:hypothetical protein
MATAVAHRRDPLQTAAVVITVLLHVGVFGGMWLARAMAQNRPIIAHDNYVDAQLVRFGKPRDLSFLPHKQGHVKDKPPELKIATDANALPRIDKEEKKDIDPLKKTHAEAFKNLTDDSEGVQPQNVGSLSGSRAGQATEAKGDPYILQLVDQIGSAWTIPTTIKDVELANLKADVCLTISESGALTHYKIVTGSGNSQFDSSLDATLSTIKSLPAPPDRDIQTPGGPRNLRSLALRGKLCPTLSK